MRPLFAIALALSLTACGEKDDTSTDTDDNGAATSDACALAADNAECPECYDGDVTCTYGEHSETRASCGGCQAQEALYAALCAAGTSASAAEIEAGTVCE